MSAETMTAALRCRRLATGLVVMGLLALGACDWGPSGEGDWKGTLVGPGEPFGSAVLMVSGEGVLDVTGDGGVLAWSRPSGEGEHRAVLVQPEGSGTLHFRVRVGDVSGPTPSVAIVELAGLDDEPVEVTDGHRLRLTR